MSASASMRCPSCNARFEPETSFCAVDGARLVAGAEDGGDPLVGAVLAERYRIVRLLGEGGMGRVYEAHHIHINKRLAIKVLHAEAVGDPATVARFRLEARAASSIGHENIVAIEDFATLQGGAVYLAMEFLEGESLGERLRRDPPLAIAEALEWMVQVCHALAAAHAARIIHRDMKPDNIFLARKGERVVPKILDFGIAKVAGEGGGMNLTHTGAIFGTPLYMSPEQADGLPLDHRADIYAMGVILYELFVGRVPFKADSTVQVLHQHIASPPPRPTVVAPERSIPPKAEAMILRALEKEPAQRQPSMEALAEELGAVLALLREPGRTPTPMPVARGQSSGQAVRSSTTLEAAPAVVPVASRPSTRIDALTPTPARAFPRVVAILVAVLVIAGLAVGLALRGGGGSENSETSPKAGTAAGTGTGTGTKTGTGTGTEAKTGTGTQKPTGGGDAVEVIIASTPVGAQIVRDGVAVAETPDTIRVPVGQTMEVVLRKEGWIDKPVLIDPAKGRKLMVKMERRSAPPSPARSAAKAAATPPPEVVARPSLVPPSSSRPSVAARPEARPVAPPPAVPPPHERVDPEPPPRPVAPVDPLRAAMERFAASVAPGARRVGAVLPGGGSSGARRDWPLAFEMGRCYDLVVKGGPGVERIYVYLWGPNGKRVADRQEGRPDVVLHHCAATSGPHHLQIKVAGGEGEYRVGVYAR
ncbi:MAG: hypothetical protein EXR72_14760 [Myxococcales bacterium]|nr:hypothetical protein [Myxococcales bacterium]